MKRTDNSVARICKSIAVIAWICGAIMFIVLAIQVNDLLGSGVFIYFLVLAIVFFIQGLMLYAIGEITQLLHNTRESNEQILTNSSQILANADLRVNATTENKAKAESLEIEDVKDSAAESADPLIRHAFLSLEDSDWDKANDLFEQALNLVPGNAKIYVGKLCCELHLKRENDLSDYEFPISISNSSNYKRALKFAEKTYRKTLEWYALTPEQRVEIEKDELENTYKALIKTIDEVRERMMKQNADENLSQYQIFNDTKECTAIISALRQLNGYKDTEEILVKLSKPVIVGNNTHCAVCGAKQQPNRTSCFRCGVTFNNA